jgi:hypothetical protein
MTRTLTITTDNDADYELLKQLAARMQARVPISQSPISRPMENSPHSNPSVPITSREHELLDRVTAPGWMEEYSTDELIELIEGSRTVSQNEIDF